MINECVPYLLKVFLFHAVAYALYWTFLRNSPHFTRNRAWLVGTLILGLMAPLVSLPLTLVPAELGFQHVALSPGTFSEETTRTVPGSASSEDSAYVGLADMVYVSGVVLLLLRSILGFLRIHMLRSRGVLLPGSVPRVVRIRELMSFSFFNTVFLGESAGSAVLLHEKGHVTGKHWADLMLIELVCILFWMNPIVWLYRKSLRQQHEYLADRYVLRQGVSCEDYLLCILHAASPGEPIGLIHKFNSQSLKQRISMMTKNDFSPYSGMLYAGALAVAAFLFLSFSARHDNTHSAGTTRVFVIDPAHGGDDAGSVSASGHSEKQIALDLAQLVLKIGSEKGLDIRLTRTTDRALSLQDRVDFSRKAKADVFLSLHLGFAESGDQNGVGMYVSEGNAKYADSKRLAAGLTTALDDIREFGKPRVHSSSALVLTGPSAASVIVEVGYLSDERDARFVSAPANQRRIAEKIVRGLMKY